MFRDIFSNALPNFWNEEGAMIAENDYLSQWQQKKEDTSSIHQLDPIIKGHHVYDVLEKRFFFSMRQEEEYIVYLLLLTSYIQTWMWLIGTY